MNDVSLIGRMTKDPAVNYGQNGGSVAHFTLAVDRRFKTDGGPTADFIRIVAFGKTAEFIEKWFHKGDPLAMSGRIQTGSYTDKDGNKVFTTDVVAEQVEFVPRFGAKEAEQEPQTANAGFLDVPEGTSEEGMPF